jgi:signal transduction histidine kinase/ActR/RegA family two-component response regulator
MTASFTDPAEMKRLASLQSYPVNLLLKEQEFDEITRLGAIICDKPVAMITFLTEDTQWIKSSVGVGLKYIQRKYSFCQHTIQHDSILEVNDTLKDKAFCTHPLVVNEPYIRFYAGVPLIMGDGQRIGTLCVGDIHPGVLTDKQKSALLYLSHCVVNLLELKKQKSLLSEQKRKAEESALAQSDFLSTMSHEIRTPLNGIAGLAHLLMEENPQPHQINYIKTIQFSANNLMSIVNDVLDFNKIEAGHIALEKIPFQLKELVSEVSTVNQIKAADKGITLKVKFDPDLPDRVIGDPLRLTQILNNLVSNAVKFTHHGGVTIEVLLAQKRPHNVVVHFAVIDTGIGIPKEKQHLLFKRFSQVDSSISRKFGGTGLGLAIIKRLLDLQGSQILVNSEEGKGSLFSFSLPFDLPSKQQKPREKIAHEFDRFDGEKILVVEDNEVNTLIAIKLLSRWDLQVIVAANGKEALEKIEKETFAAILMDIQMPVMDGYEATRKIREKGYLPSALPIIGLSASTALGEIDHARMMGMNDFVTKPFNPDELHMKLKKYLHNVKTR